MQVSCTARERNLIVKITGDVDHYSAEQIRDRIDREVSAKNCRNIIFDFSAVSFMDSSGIGMIIGRYKNIEHMGGKVVMAAISSPVLRLFRIAGLHKIISCCDTVEAAVKSL